MTKEKITTLWNNRNIVIKLSGNKEHFDYEIPWKNIELFEISSLTKNILERIDHITSIDISNCNLSIVPKAFGDLPLRELNISHNLFTQIPDCLYTSLYRITNLDVSYNFIQEFLAPNCLLSLKVLKINSNKLKTMPSWIWESSIRLKELDLSDNSFIMNTYGIMFKTFLSTCRLTRLTVADCKFGNNDAYILSRIPNLLYLHIGNNVNSKNKSQNNWDIPVAKLDCKNTLKTLIAHNLYLSALPDDINELSALNCINIAFNNLHWLPENFTLLKNLRICDASNNVLSYFPLNFLQLNSLSELYLAHNCLTVLPNLIELKNLRVLDLYNNSLETIDKQLIDSMLEIDFDLNYIEYDDCDLIFKKKVKLRERLNLTRLDEQKSKPPPSIETNSVTSQSWEDHESDDYLEDDQIVEYIERDTKSESDVEIWDDVNYLDDNFLPSPISIQPRFEKLKLSSSPVYEYDLYEIFKDAD